MQETLIFFDFGSEHFRLFVCLYLITGNLGRAKKEKKISSNIFYSCNNFEDVLDFGGWIILALDIHQLMDLNLKLFSLDLIQKEQDTESPAVVNESNNCCVTPLLLLQIIKYKTAMKIAVNGNVATGFFSWTLMQIQ
ncbi:hypothetical protein ACJX0J_036522 [Zea mays]